MRRRARAPSLPTLYVTDLGEALEAFYGEAAPERPTLRVTGARSVHPILVPPKVPFKDETSAIPASVLRRLGWPEAAIPQANKDADTTFRPCIATRGMTECPCGAYALEWDA